MRNHVALSSCLPIACTKISVLCKTAHNKSILANPTYFYGLFTGDMMSLQNWVLFALASAFFAALTAIFGKLGVAGINSNMATFIRTIVILIVTAGIISARAEWQKPETISPNSWLFLVLSGVATGLSWLCYYRALQLGPVTKVAPIDKLSVAFAIVLGILFLGEKLTWPLALGGLLIVAGSIIMIVF